MSNENITLNPFYDCPLCGESQRVMLSKKGKPYITCNSCGLQMFIRYLEGIERLKEKTYE